MRMVYFLATLTLAAAAAGAQQRAPGPAPTQGAAPGQRATAGEQKSPAAGEAGTAAPPAAEQKVGEAPTVPAGETAAEAAAPVPESGEIAKVNVQGNRRVETDAIPAALPLKVGDTYDKEKLKSAMLAVWRVGPIQGLQLDGRPAKPPLTGNVLTVLVR